MDQAKVKTSIASESLVLAFIRSLPMAVGMALLEVFSLNMFSFV